MANHGRTAVAGTAHVALARSHARDERDAIRLGPALLHDAFQLEVGDNPAVFTVAEFRWLVGDRPGGHNDRAHLQFLIAAEPGMEVPDDTADDLHGRVHVNSDASLHQFARFGVDQIMGLDPGWRQIIELGELTA